MDQKMDKKSIENTKNEYLKQMWMNKYYIPNDKKAKPVYTTVVQHHLDALEYTAGMYGKKPMYTLDDSKDYYNTLWSQLSQNVISKRYISEPRDPMDWL